jgi:uncharacterized membrane protein YidH (DUF202 family)
LHGAAFFWNSRLPLLPWWLNQLELDIRNAKQPTGNFTGLSRSKSLKPLIDGKYRMGYLESLLERSSTLKRAESTNKNTTSLLRGSSTRSVRPRNGETPLNRAATLTRKLTANGNRSGNNASSNSPVFSAGTNKNDNPFDDPIWSQHDITFDRSSPMLARQDSFADSSRNRTLASDGRRTADFDTSSADFLMSGKQTPRSSYMHNEKHLSNDKLGERARLNAYFDEDLNAMEEGNNEKKKKKKNKDADKGAQLEPKVYFANERTFIQWLHFSALLLSVALTLMNFGDGINKIVGGVFFGIAFIFAVYGFCFNRWRAHRINTKPHLRYDDTYGPVFLCIILIGALSVRHVVMKFVLDNTKQSLSYFSSTLV